MSDISDLNSLLAAIKPRLNSAGSLIAIEGHSPAGKTFLSKALAAASGGVPIGTDTYVDKNRKADTYLDHIMVEKLALALNQLRRSHRIVFIEGICSPAGLWTDDPQNYLENGSPRSDLSWVDQQSVVYHLRARPLENADIVFARHEE